jgi:hypothetical protein
MTIFETLSDFSDPHPGISIITKGTKTAMKTDFVSKYPIKSKLEDT